MKMLPSENQSFIYFFTKMFREIDFCFCCCFFLLIFLKRGCKGERKGGRGREKHQCVHCGLGIEPASQDCALNQVLNLQPSGAPANTITTEHTFQEGNRIFKAHFTRTSVCYRPFSAVN